jgi:hypothetical protein
MRFGTVALKDVLKGSFNWRYVADVFANGVRVLQDLPVTNVRLADDSTSLVQGTGSLTVAYSGDFADSVAPSAIGDVLSPFGSQVALSVLVTAGAGFQERIPLGQYLISETPSILVQRYVFNTATVSKGDLIDLNLKDLMYGVQRDRFDVPGSPPDLSSVYKEIQRLTGLPVTKTVTDGAISTTVAYQQDKLQAVYDLATVLDATACMTADGTVSLRPNVWPAVVDTINSGDGGTLISVGKAMSNDNVYNTVIIRSDASDGSGVLGRAELTSGPLRVANTDGSLSPYRRVPYFYSSPFLTTQAQANDYAATLLPRVSKLRSVSVDVEEVFTPLRDLGDVVTVNRLGETFTGRVTAIRRDSGATLTTTLAVGQ